MKYPNGTIQPNYRNISYTLDVGGPYGQMPHKMLIDKFEETDLGETETIYENYARGTLMDRSPDPRSLECDQVQKNNDSKGFLNLRYTGTRSGQSPSHPEIFLGLHGDDNFEPRGVATDPDYKELKKQQEYRQKRYYNFEAGGGNNDWHRTDGVRSEAREITDMQKVYKLRKDRLKLFTTSKDGRREGMRRTFKHTSDANKTLAQQTYGEHITHNALNAQRHTVIMSNKIIARSKLYNQFTSDHEFKVAKYGTDPRSGVSRIGTRNMRTHTHNDGDFNEHNKTLTYQATGVIMGKIVNVAKKQSNDINYKEGYNTQTRKTEKMNNDLTKLLHLSKNERNFAKSDNILHMKTMTPKQIEHLKRSQFNDNKKSPHVTLNAELMYKSVKPGADVRKLQDSILSDTQAKQLREERTVNGKTSGGVAKTGKNRANVVVNGKALKTPKYKTKYLTTNQKRIENSGFHNFAACGDLSQSRKTANSIYKNPQTTQNETNIEFLDNGSGSRRGAFARMGSKSMRYSTSDGMNNEIATFS